MQSNVTQQRVPIVGDPGPWVHVSRVRAMCASSSAARLLRTASASSSCARPKSCRPTIFPRKTYAPIFSRRARRRRQCPAKAKRPIGRFARRQVGRERGLELFESIAAGERDQRSFRLRLAQDGQVDGRRRRALQACARSLQARRCAAEQAPCARRHRRPDGRRDAPAASRLRDQSPRALLHPARRRAHEHAGAERDDIALPVQRSGVVLVGASSATRFSVTWFGVIWTPIPEIPKIKGLVCFFHERGCDIYVDGELVPQPKTKWASASAKLIRRVGTMRALHWDG